MSGDLVFWLSMLAFILGIVALIIEIFVAPGFGVSGVIGIILLLWGVFLSTADVAQTVSALVIALVASIILFLILLKLFSRFNFWQKMTLSDKQENSNGYVAPINKDNLEIGLEGITITPLRPAGTAEFLGRRIDVVTGGDFISKGAKIRLIQLEGVKVVVEEIK